MASEVLKKALLASANEEYFEINNACSEQVWEPSDEFVAAMSRLVSGEKKRKLKSMKKVLFVAAVIILISIMTVFSFAQVRETIINSFRKIYATHFVLEYGFDDAGDINKTENMNTEFTPGYIPEGFIQVDINRNEHSAVTVWEKDENETIILSQGDGISKRNIDNERLEEKTVFDNGVEYKIYSEKGYMLILWNTSEFTFSIDYFGDMPTEELIKIAGSTCMEGK